MKNNKFYKINKTTLGLLSLLLISLNSTNSYAAEVCVDNAADLDTALMTAASSGEDDIIKVVQGTYNTLNQLFLYISSQSFGLEIKGGYTNSCTSRTLKPSNTILDGESLHRVMQVDQSDGDSLILIEGFTFQNGKNSMVDFAQGTGLFINGITNFTGEIIVRNNIFKQNENPNSSSGGVSIESKGNCALVNNLLINNIALSQSAGSVNCNGILSFITQNTATGNTNTVAGGAGLQVGGNASLLAINNIFWNNSNYDFLINSPANLLISNNIGILVGTAGAGSTNNISLDPKFVSLTDFRLKPDSPSVGVGDMGSVFWASLVPDVDLSGSPRVSEDKVDMGAYQTDFSDLCVVVPVNPSGVVQFCL